MNREEFKIEVERCCEAIEKNQHYRSYDAVLEIMGMFDQIQPHETVSEDELVVKFLGLGKTKQIKSGELFECEGRKYIIKNTETASQKDNLGNGQSIFILQEIE